MHFEENTEYPVSPICFVRYVCHGLDLGIT